MGRFILIWVFIFWGGLMAWGAQPYSPQIVNPLTEPWRWKHFPELEGKGIRHVVESADQKVWVSYNDGVLEYDGYDWKTHNQENGLTASPVEQLLVAKDGAIYATASNGIFRYNGLQWTPVFTSPEDQTMTFHSIKQLRDQSVIACADWGFIHLLTNGNTRIYTSEVKANTLKAVLPGPTYVLLPPDFLTKEGDMIYASDVLETKAGEVWFALTTKMEMGKLLRFKWKEVQDGKFDQYEVIASKDNFELGEDQRMLQAADGRIWVINSTSNKGIHIYDGENWETIFINKIFGSDEYLADIVQSVNGTIWLSSMAKIFAYHQGHWAVYKAPVYPVPANRVILQNSQSDQIWVAGYKSKVLLLDFSTEQWLTYENLSFQCEVAPNQEWFLERNNRLVFREGNTWTSYGVEDGLMDAPIRVIKTTQGQIWAAGSHQGYAATAVLKNGTWERHIHRELSWGIDYRAVFEARDGSLWFGGAVDGEKVHGFYSGVLQLVDPKAGKLTWKHHPFQENGLNQANSYGIGQSKDGNIWLGGSQLLFYNGKTWNSLPDERLQQYVNYVCSTDKLLLVGSRYYGLFVYDGKEWKNHNTSSGLSGNTIISIDALSDSMIIVATENGISKFDGKSWTQNIFPERLNMDFEGGTIYHTDNYIWVNHVPRSWKRRAYQRNKSEEENGQFFTTRYRPSSKPPETSFDFFLESVSSDGNTLISWKGKDYFAKTAATQLMYAYRLNGKQWSPFTKDQQFTFTSLPSGTHTLEVRARDLDFNVDPTPARIEFKVLPPIWKQAWFIALILAFLAIFLVYEYRVISKKKKLEILNESLRQANDKLKERGRKIETQNREILAQQGQILEQSKILETNNIDLESRNEEIRQQRDQLEEMIEQVESLSKAKLGFFTNISHELRTPITLILGPISQLIKESGKLTLERRQQYYGTIERNASRLLKLINQLLEMRRIEHSTLELNLSGICLADYISSMVDLFDGLALNRDIHLEYLDHTDNNITLLDSDKVEKIIVNLLSNAFKFTPEGSSITVELSTVKASENNLSPFYENYFEIIVEDTGIGMSQEIIDLIFDKYYTSGEGVNGSHHSGIGLYYVKDLVYLMQGEIKVDSQLGKGTKFTIYLPQVLKKEELTKDTVLEKPALKMAREEASLLMDTLQEETTHSTTTSPAHEHSQAPRVLVVEDNPDMQHFLEDILSRDYLVSTANNGLEGLKMARNQSFDLILSDVMMPEMDGITFCEKIKDDFATSHIPVILLTAKAMEESKLEGYTKGADDYITKPFNPELLLVRVNNLLQQREQLREVFNKNFMLTPKTETIASPDEEFLARLVNLMNENLSEAEFNVKSMCQSMHLSHMHFIRKVKQLTGKKPIDLLKSFRMTKAKDLLIQQKLTIAEIAYKVGFDLPNSFSRSFKKEFDLTPTEFVKTISETNEYPDSEELTHSGKIHSIEQ
ncbi:response regulator [Lewinella sp. LCG006]|uniref:hybrid sensor histidine kinase/response regulator transcription factor n=1 Tax=Lewinella sp. LCG006 TaxID=3231911 RepID=UPI00345F2BC3